MIKISGRETDFKTLFRKHSNITIKHLKRKWNIASLEAYVEAKLIPWGLRERIILAEHLDNDRFLNVWKGESIKHGLHLMGLIVAEEKTQVEELEEQLQESVKILDGYQDIEELERFNDRLKNRKNIKEMWQILSVDRYLI